MKNNADSAQVKSNSGFSHFDFDRIARRAGGLISREEIGEIFNATKNNPHLIYFLLRSFVKNPARILVGYRGTYCRLPDYPANPKADVPLVVSLVLGSVLSESYGKHRGDHSKNGIFDAVAIITGLTGEKDFPKVYALVRKAYDEFKSRPPLSEAEVREILVETVQRKKERCLPYIWPFFDLPIRRCPKARQIWKRLPLEIQEEFGGSPPKFKDFLSDLALEDAGGEFFRVIEHRYSGNVTRFQFIHPGTTVSEDSTGKTGKNTS